MATLNKIKVSMLTVVVAMVSPINATAVAVECTTIKTTATYCYTPLIAANNITKALRVNWAGKAGACTYSVHDANDPDLTHFVLNAPRSSFFYNQKVINLKSTTYYRGLARGKGCLIYILNDYAYTK